jgi:clan AA aspartic protease (TIGR02281 family)
MKTSLSICILITHISLSASLAQEPAAPAAAAPGPTPAEAKAALEAAGFKVTVTGIALPAEAEFAKQMKDVLTIRKNFLAVEKEFHAAEAELDQFNANITAMKQEMVRMNAALANNLPVEQHNRIVGALRAMDGQIELSEQQQKKGEDKIKSARAKANEAREAYVEKLLQLRAEADKVEQIWAKAAADPKQQAALVKVNEVLKKSLALKPTPVFTSAAKQLSQYEDKVLSENIKLRDDDDTLWASVVINGKHTKEMVVDSGSNSISLPFTLAKEMGIEVLSADPKVRVILADGREVPGTLKKLESVRVGKFIVEDVECIVLDEVAIKATPLLGMSFLGHFKFEVDKARQILKMVKIDTEVSGAGNKPGKERK